MNTALAFCQRLVDWPRAPLITPGRRHWELFTDSNFARFPGLRWHHPLAAT